MAATFAPPRGSAFIVVAGVLLTVAVQVFLCRNAVGSAPLADVDSVCHTAYLDYFTREFFPNTGSLLGFTPRYNLGAPFLFFNVPPGTTALGFLLTKLGLSPVAAIKAILVLSWLAVTPLVAAIAATFRQRRPEVPIVAAVVVAALSSNLSGLDFYFRDGMVNPCLALPLVLATFLCALRAEVSRRTRFRWLAGAALLFAATVLVHVLSGYFAALAVAAVPLAAGRRIGRAALGAALILALGGAMSAFWTVPSAEFAPKGEAVLNWVRPPRETLEAFLDGSLLSGFRGGFLPAQRSNIGIVTVPFGVLGLARAWTRDRSLRAVALLFALSLLIALGPSPAWGLGWLPAYPRLLWLRFLTPALVLWPLLVSHGVSVTFDAVALWSPRHAPRGLRGLLLAVAVVLFGAAFVRSRDILTVAAYPRQLEDYQEVVRWLRDHGDRRDRVYGEFLVPEPDGHRWLSVNWLRQRLAVDTGLREVGGWIYENNPASVALVRGGEFWWNSRLLTDDAARLGMRWVVVGTAAGRTAFASDVRWERTLHTDTFDVFRARGDAVGIATLAGTPLREVDDSLLAGGGYRVRYQGNGAPGHVEVRMNWSHRWSALVDGVPTAVEPAADGFIALDAGSPFKELELRWSPPPSARIGRVVSAIALLFALGLLARPRFGARFRGGPALTENVGRVGAAVGLTGALLLGFRQSVPTSGMGVVGGFLPIHNPTSLVPGTAWESEPGPIQRKGTSPVGFDGSPRIDADKATFVFHLGPRASVQLDGDDESAFELHFGAQPACVVKGRWAAAVAIPDGCKHVVEGDPTPMIDATVAAQPGALIRRVSVKDATFLLEAEQFENVLNDGRSDALWSSGFDRSFPSGGLTVFADAPVAGAVRMRTRAPANLGAARYQVYLRVAVASARDAAWRGLFEVFVDGRSIGGTDAILPNAPRLPTPAASFQWMHVGSAAIHGGANLAVDLRRHYGSPAGFGEWDAMLLVAEP